MVYRNGMLGLRARKDATLIVFAGNLAVIVVAKHPEVGEFYGNETIHDIKSWLQMVKLYLADETTEAVLITNSKKSNTVKI